MAGKAQGNGDEAEKGIDFSKLGKSGTVETPSAFALLVRKMGQIATMDEANPSITGDDIIPILEADTEEEMWDADERPQYNAKLLSGCVIQVYGIEVKFGTGDNTDIKTPFVDPESGRQMYLLVHSARLTVAGEKKEYRLPEVGELFTWNTSARNIVGKLMWMLNHGWFDPGHAPVQFRIEGTPLQGGKSIEKIKKLDEPIIMQSAELPF
jgi:hypothetical protein